MKKYWTYEEISYMKNHWGKISIADIAKNLNRSINAVRIKANKIGLKDLKLYMDEISINQLQCIIYGQKGGQFSNLINKIPFKYKKIVNDKIRVIDIYKFWNWFKKNKHLISLHKTTKNSFGYEPEWVEEKRQADKRAHEYTRQRPWTDAEDSRLKELLKSYKYGYRDISVMLKRTEGSIKRRMCDLKIKERPLRADNHNPWTPEEIKTVKDLYLKGYKTCIIAEYVERSALAINGLIERYNNFKNKN